MVWVGKGTGAWCGKETGVRKETSPVGGWSRCRSNEGEGRGAGPCRDAGAGGLQVCFGVVRGVDLDAFLLDEHLAAELGVFLHQHFGQDRVAVAEGLDDLLVLLD